LGESHLEEGLGELFQLRGEGVFVLVRKTVRASIRGGPLLILDEAGKPAPEGSLIGERGGLDIVVPLGSGLEPDARSWCVGFEGVAMALVDASLARLSYPKLDGHAEGNLG
jgi:hypothetical protein